MKQFVVVCLAILVLLSVVPAYSARADEDLSPFIEAKRIGEPNARCFYLFSTSVGNYTITHAGMGEVFIRGRRKVFHVKVEARRRIERLYYFEYEGDLLLLYEAGESGYFVRMDQKTKKLKATGAIEENFEPPLLKDRRIVFSDGTEVLLN